jgi:hypothetical protein
LASKPEGKILLGRPRHRWEDNTRMDLREIAWEGADCIHLAQEGRQAIVNRFHKRREIS